MTDFGYQPRHAARITSLKPWVDGETYNPRHGVDSDLTERVAFALYRASGGMDYPAMSSVSDREFYMPRARAAMAAMREAGAA